MTNLHLILGDQLSHNISSLKGYDLNSDIILMCEVIEEATYVKHHKKKLVFIFSSMRHFAKELKQKGYYVEYIKLDDQKNTGSFRTEVERMLKKCQIDKIIVTHPGEYRVLKDIESWREIFNIEIKIIEDDRFLCSIDDFKQWIGDRKQLRMEYFYRYMRKKYNILIKDNKPVGNKWNFDKENREYPDISIISPDHYQLNDDNITKEIIKLVENKFKSHFGDIKSFNFAVNRKEALIVLKKFIKERLNNYGRYQDAMVQDNAFLFHSCISFYLNVGLLNPLECIKAAENAYYNDLVPLNSVEGFIRQILGWREYVRGIYWLKMPEYKSMNYFNNFKKLPSFYWNANTDLNCLKQCINDTKKHSYANHIQRLMVLGNFALLIDVDPKEVNEWYMIVYADAFEWVELPNVSGMVLFADGGFLGTKPYVSGGGYINKMSNYCKSCQFNVDLKNGNRACPFNYLYWNFLINKRDKLINNHRMRMMYSIIDQMTDQKKREIQEDSQIFLDKLNR